MSRAVLPNFEKSQLVVAKTIDSEAQIIQVISSMEYYFNELDATKFQRLINSILNARFGVDTRLTPLRGSDGGRDAETAPGNPYFEYQVGDVKPSLNNIFTPPRKGRYLFQVKHHRTGDTRISDVRQSVLSDFEQELKKNVLNRTGDEQVNYFFLITNVSSSKDSLEKLDKKRDLLIRKNSNLHVDIWWKEQLIAFLDAMPNLWLSFPEIFAGGKVPFVAEVAGQTDKRLSRALRIAINKQYDRDSKVKFRQIDLENDLSKLFVDLDVNLELLSRGERAKFLSAEFKRLRANSLEDLDNETADFWEKSYRQRILHNNNHLVSALGVLLCEVDNVGDLKDVEDSTSKILLEGGPGQGKSTITQMAVQIYRSQILGKHNLDPDNRWAPPRKVRLPLRIELRRFAEWLSKNLENSVEQFLAHILSQDSGGSQISTDDIHNIVESSPVLLIFDGLDEVGSDTLRDEVITKILDCVNRFEDDLSSNIKVIITTRPPAVSGRREKLSNFTRLPISSLETERIKDYLNRWLSAQLGQDTDEQNRVRESFDSRKDEPLVKPLIKNPMQLSVLLHFIRLKGDAFPDHRAELYKEYFQIVIDRDVEKSPALRESRRTIEALHQFLAYKIHSLTEADTETEQIDGTLERGALLELVQSWLKDRDDSSEKPEDLFKIGEDRLGLIVILRGEGEEAKYGYEIQPIREYFTAAYIDEQVEGDANNIFASMIRRPYWKEVALFLAGLRRPREKADLLIRAKELDKEENLGWRQDGRSIVLQLLQEGAFSDPPYVLSDALEFVFDLLNPRNIIVQNEPEEFLSALPTLLKQYQNKGGVKKLIEALANLLKDFQTSNDEYVIERLYRVASQILSKSQLREALLAHRSNSPTLTAKIRLEWAYRWGVDMRDIARLSSFWEGTPAHIWAESWWLTSLRYDEVTNLLAPSHLHQYLAIKFATNPISLNDYNSQKKFFIEPQSNWAIWVLFSYQQILQLFASESRHSHYRGREVKRELNLPDIENIQFVGLDEEIVPAIKDMLAICHAVADSLLSSQSLNIDDYIYKIIAHLETPGLVSWITCECSKNMIAASLIKSYDGLEGKFLDETSGLHKLISSLKAFYTGSVSKSLDFKGVYEFLSERFEPFYPYVNHSHPKYLLVDSGRMISVSDAFLSHFIDEKELPFDWLANIPLSNSIIKPLVSGCIKLNINFLPKLLNSINNLFFAYHLPYASPLLAQEVNRILKVARKEDSPTLLRGAFLAVSTSKFIKSAGSNLILKLIQNNHADANLIANVLFKRRYRDPDEIDVKETEIISEVAKNILDNPDSYAFKVVCSAASYLFEREPLHLPPLIHEEEVLNLKVRKSIKS
jgi:hypothetical protein